MEKRIFSHMPAHLKCAVSLSILAAVLICTGPVFASSNPSSADTSYLPRILVAPNQKEVIEGETVKFIFALESGLLNFDLNIDIVVAAKGAFFNPVPERNQTVTLEKGKNLLNFRIDTVDDQTYEHDGSVEITIQPSPFYAIEPDPDSGKPQSTARIPVLNDDFGTTPKILVAAAGTSVFEGSPASFVFASEPYELESDLEVSISVLTAGMFFNPVPERNQTVVMKKGSNLQYFRVQTVGDEIYEPDGSVEVSIKASSNYDILLHADSGVQHSSAKVLVFDDDEQGEYPKILLAQTLSSVVEGNPAVFAISTRSATPIEDFDLVVNLKVELKGDFFNRKMPNSFVLEVGKDVGFLEIPTVSDGKFDAEGSVKVTLEEGRRYLVADAPNNMGVVRIKQEDEPLPIVFVTSNSNQVNEGERLDFYLELLNVAPEKDIFINLKVARAGGFGFQSHVGGRTLINEFPTGIMVAAGKFHAKFSVDILDDSIESPFGRIKVDVLAGQGYVPVSGSAEHSSSVTIEIPANDLPVFQIIEILSETEEGWNAEFLVYSDKLPQSGVVLRFESSGENGVIQAGEFPYVPESQFSSGYYTSPRVDSRNFTWKVSIPTIDNLETDEGGERVATLKLMDGYGYNVGEKSSASVRILDNDQVVIRPMLTISAVEESVDEGSDALFDIALSGRISKELRVGIQVSVNAGNSIVCVLICNLPTVAIVEAGENRVQVAVPTVDDAIFDKSSRMVTVSLLPEPAKYGINNSLNSSATVKVDENDREGVVRFAVAANVIMDILVADDGNSPTGTPDEAPFPATQSPRIPGWTIEDATSVVSVVSVFERIEEGEYARFQILSSSPKSSDLPVNVRMLTKGDFLRDSLLDKVKLPKFQTNVEFGLATRNDHVAEEDGSVSVQLLEGAGYELADSSKSIAEVIISDAEDREYIAERIVSANHAVLPGLFEEISRNPLSETSKRLNSSFAVQGYDGPPGSTVEMLQKMLIRGGSMANSEKPDWSLLLNDFAFDSPILSDEAEYGLGTLWARGSFGYLNNDFGDIGNLSGSRSTFAVGTDSRISESVTVGLSSSFTGIQAEYAALDLDDLHYSLNSTGLHPYLGWVSRDGDAGIKLAASYGTGELNVAEEEHDLKSAETSLFALSIEGRRNLYSLKSISDSNSTGLTINGRMQTASHATDEIHEFIAGDNFSSRFMHVWLEGTHSWQSSREHGIGPSATIGFIESSEGLNSGTCFNAQSGLDYEIPAGNLEASIEQSVLSCENRLPALNFSGSIEYDEGSDSRGWQYSIISNWIKMVPQKKMHSIPYEDLLKHENALRGGLEARLEYGFKLPDSGSLITPYSELELGGKGYWKLSAGSRISIGTDSLVAFEASQSSSEIEKTDRKIELKGVFNW